MCVCVCVCAGEDRAKRFGGYETLFGLQNTDFSRVDNAKKELQWHSNKWTYLHDFIDASESWYNGASATAQPPGIFFFAHARGVASRARAYVLRATEGVRSTRAL